MRRSALLVLTLATSGCALIDAFGGGSPDEHADGGAPYPDGGPPIDAGPPPDATWCLSDEATACCYRPGPVEVATSVAARAVAVADFDGDAHLDVAAFAGGISVHAGDGQGGLGPYEEPLFGGGYTGFLAVGMGPGLPAGILGYSSTTMGLWVRNPMTGAWESHGWALLDGDAVDGMVAVDHDADGDDDIAFLHPGPTLELFGNDGDALTPLLAAPTGYADNLVGGDFDPAPGDELADSNMSTMTRFVLADDGTMVTPGTPTAFSSWIRDAAVFRYPESALDAIAVAMDCPDPPCDAILQIGQGATVFYTLSGAGPVPYSFHELLPARLDRDGGPGLLLTRAEATYPDAAASAIALRGWNGTAFPAPRTLELGVQALDVAVGDLNEDGCDDLVIVTGETKLWLLLSME